MYWLRNTVRHYSLGWCTMELQIVIAVLTRSATEGGDSFVVVAVTAVVAVVYVLRWCCDLTVALSVCSEVLSSLL